MADAIVSGLVQQVTTLMAREIQEEVRLVTGTDKEIRKLINNLQALHAVLVDAEQRQANEETVRLWLDQLKQASYDMEDVLDEWITARLKLKIEGGDDTAVVFPRKKVCPLSFITSPCFGFKQVSLRRDIAYKIKQINENLDDIAKAKDMFNFNVNVIKSVEKSERVPSISLIDESEICGRDDDKNTLISKLLCLSSGEQKGFRVISLVGMGGIGKTTLAQLAYNNHRVKRNFDKTMWVCVSDPFDEFKIANAIIEALEGYASNLVEFQSLMEHINKSIVNKRFLLILDDVWNEDYNKWEPFCQCLKNGLRGSKILITTRNETVACMMGSTDNIHIKHLEEGECWSLLKRLAFFDRSNENCEKLEHIGRKIAGKCKGLPLAAKAIGSLLRSKQTEEEWQRILDSKLWKLKELEKGLLPAMMLSYIDLPSMVKRCFSYCAVFPKDYKIHKDRLIKLWMAQGYLSVEQDEEMEIVGQEYFNILASRSFFQEFHKYNHDIVSCKMHDMVHDLAQFLCKNECFTMEINGSEESFTKSFGENVRHLMLKLYNRASFPVSISKAKRLRSLIIEDVIVEPPSPYTEVVANLFSELACLRTFDINGGFFCLKEIPREVGKMIHLRYLNLSQQNMEQLPETLCELNNLQILDITLCSNLKELPQGIGKLINLRHLLNGYTHSLSCMPTGIARVTSLRTLKKLVVGDGGVNGGRGCKLECLETLNLLRECCIEGLGNVSDVGEAKRSELVKKKNLFDLNLNFASRDLEGRRKNKEDEELLEALQLPPNLKRLEIVWYRGNSFPSWNWMMSLTNLRSLSLNSCKNCEHLPPLGKLPSLEELNIWGFDSVKRVCDEFLGLESNCGSTSASSSSYVISFPKLKSLHFLSMNELEEWEYRITRNEEITPRLASLTVRHCPILKTLPDYLLRKTTLQELKIENCSILQERYEKGSGEEWPRISHIPKTHIF